MLSLRSSVEEPRQSEAFSLNVLPLSWHASAFPNSPQIDKVNNCSLLARIRPSLVELCDRSQAVHHSRCPSEALLDSTVRRLHTLRRRHTQRMGPRVYM